MFKVSGFALPKLPLIFILGIFAVLFSIDAYAQEENTPRHVDKPILEENIVVQENSQGSPTLLKPSVTKQASVANPIKKEIPSTGIIQEREMKKNESPSTLSFNIFLYIVDKFKED